MAEVNITKPTNMDSPTAIDSGLPICAGLIDIDEKLNNKQAKYDPELATIDKTIVGAINEIYNTGGGNGTGDVDLSNYYNKQQSDNRYLQSIPSDYVTENELNAKGYLTDHQDLSAYAKTSAIPTKVSQLTNDKNYLTTIPSEYVTDTELNAKGYLTSTPVEVAVQNNQPTSSALWIDTDSNDEITLAEINDNTTSDGSTYSSNKIVSMFNGLNEEIVDLKEQGLQFEILYAEGETVEEALAWLEENGDTTKVYFLPNGNQARYTTIEISGGIEEVTERVTGEFLDNTRLSTSSGTPKDATGYATTPFVNISKLPNGGKIKLTGIRWAYNYNADYDGYAFTLWANGTKELAGYIKNRTDASYNFKIDVLEIDTTTDTSIVEVTPADGSVFKGFTDIRFCGYGTSANAIVELIYKKETQGGTESKWVDTGRGLISSDYDERLIKVENTTDYLKAEVSDLKNNGSQSSEGVPSYVLTEAENIADLVLNSRNAYSFVMALTSDIHTTGSDASATGVKHMGMAMNQINAITQIDLIAVLGDVMVGYFDESYEDGFKHVKKCFHDISKAVPYIQMQGNHDQLPADTTAEARQKYYSRIGANNIGTVTDFNNRFRNYGYRDFEDQRFRVIYLNSADVSDEEITDDCYISKEQFTWLVNTALNFSNKENSETWHFIVCCHHPLNWLGTSMPNLLSILDAYKGGTSGSITVDGTSIAYNFSSNTRPKFVAHFHGHIHNFRTEKLGTNGVLSITIPNACFDRNNEYGTYSGYTDEIHTKYGDVDENGSQRQFNKESNTSNDTSFNVVVVDMGNEEIHAYCYGAGIHRTVTFDGVLTEVEKDEVDEPTTPTPSYTNLVPTSIGTDKKVYNETGYKEGYRLNSSGTETQLNGSIHSGYIRYDGSSTIRAYGGTDKNKGATGNTIQLFDSNFSFIQAFGATYDEKITYEELNGKYLMTISLSALPKLAEAIYIRISFAQGTGSDFVITLNEEITF